MDKGILFLQGLLDLEHQLVLTQQLRAARIDWSGGLDPKARKEEAVADRAYELEIELTVEKLQERLLEAGLVDAKDRIDQILSQLAERELENME